MTAICVVLPVWWPRLKLSRTPVKHDGMTGLGRCSFGCLILLILDMTQNQRHFKLKLSYLNKQKKSRKKMVGVSYGCHFRPNRRKNDWITLQIFIVQTNTCIKFDLLISLQLKKKEWSHLGELLHQVDWPEPWLQHQRCPHLGEDYQSLKKRVNHRKLLQKMLVGHKNKVTMGRGKAIVGLMTRWKLCSMINDGGTFVWCRSHEIYKDDCLTKTCKFQWWHHHFCQGLIATLLPTPVFACVGKCRLKKKPD